MYDLLTYKKSTMQAQMIWPILTSLASTRSTVRYPKLCQLIGLNEKATGMSLGWALGHIQGVCRANELPHLNLLVVNRLGIPGSGANFNYASFCEDLESVYNYNWVDIQVPSLKTLEECFNEYFSKEARYRSLVA